MVSDARPVGVVESDRVRPSAYDGDPWHTTDNVVRSPTAWRAILGGAALAMTVQLVLTLIGVAIAAAMADPDTSLRDPAASLGAAALIWGCLSGLISFGIGGYIAGMHSHAPRLCSGMTHGVLVWAAAGIFGMTLAALSGAAIAGGAASGLPRTPGLAMGDMGGGMGGGFTGGGRSSGMGMSGMSGGGATSDRSGTGSSASGSSSGSGSMSDGRMSDEEMREAARRAAKYTSRASLFGAIALIMGAVGGAVGGTMGRKAREKAIGNNAAGR